LSYDVTRHGALQPGADPAGLRGRYFILNVGDISEAVAWALRCPAAANGDVEVRPVEPK